MVRIKQPKVRHKNLQYRPASGPRDSAQPEQLHQPKLFTVATQNVRGIRKNDLANECSNIANLMTKFNVDILGCTETTLEWSRQLQSRAKRQLPPELQGPLLGSSGSDLPKGKYPRGGTLQILSKKTGGRQKFSGMDKISRRWVWSKLVGAYGRTIKIYTTYRSCKPPPNVGDITWHAILSNNLTRRDDPLYKEPRKAILRDLALEIEYDQSNGVLPIVMMDANYPADDHEIRYFATNLRLVDPFDGGRWTDTPTFDRGKARIDLILIHRDLERAIHNIEIVPSSVY